LKLIVTTFMTLDGVAQGPGSADEDRSGGFEHGGWLVPHVDEDFGRAMEGWFASADAFLLGRKTYEVFAGTWGQTSDENTIVTKLNTLPKYVPTSTLDKAEWEGTTLLRGDLAESVTKLKAESEGELQVHGSITLARSLVKADLVDEFRLLIFPVVLGTGRRLFDEIIPTGLKLVDSKPTSTGVMIQTYQATGRPEYGVVPSFG
jgi:dihydrofolate reductase